MQRIPTLCLALTAPWWFGGFPPGAYATAYPAESLYSLALHMHGSMSEQSGSWEWHTAKAESLGVDIIWWTDHDWRLSNDRVMKRYDFESAFWDTAASRWTEPDGDFPGEFRYWEPDPATLDFLHTSIADTLGFQSTRSFRLEATADPDSAFRAGYVTQTCSDFQNHYSLAKHVALRLRVFPEALDPADARLVFEVELSDHPQGPMVLRYILGSTEGEGAHSIPLAFTPGTWNDYLVDVTADALTHFSAGGIDSLRVLDNTLAFVRLALECRNASHAVALVDEGDYFALLGVTRQATGYDIRRSYIELRRQFDPGQILRPNTLDLQRDVDTILSVLEEAYEILRDQQRRERYRRAIESLP